MCLHFASAHAHANKVNIHDHAYLHAHICTHLLRLYNLHRPIRSRHVQKIMEKYDVNGDGVFSADEVAIIVQVPYRKI